MMNYRVKYSIATYSVHNQKENIAILGVYDIHNNKYIEDFMLYIEKNTDKEIILESSLGGGAGFPLIEKATNIIMKNHENALKEYLNNIIEDTIIMFSSNNRYELIVIYLLSLYAKELNKKIICMSLSTFKFEGKFTNSRFENIWNKIKNQANETILIDSNLDDERIRPSTKINTVISLSFNQLFKRLYDLSTK